MNTGERIKKIRQEKGLSQKELGKLLNVSQQMVGIYESSQAKLKPATLSKIATALGTDIGTLNGDYASFKKQLIQDNPALRAYERIDGFTGKMSKDYLNHKILNELNITDDKKELIYNYNKLNELGQKEAQKRVEELTEIKKYTALDPSSSDPE